MLNSRSISDVRHGYRVDENSTSSPAQSVGANQTQSFEILRLPLELRTQIYETLFSDHSDAADANIRYACRDKSKTSVRARTQAPKHLSLTMASKQVYSEAFPILYKTYNFRLSAWDDSLPDRCGTDLILRLLRQLQRPLAVLIVPWISCLDLFVDMIFDAYSMSLSSALQLIDHSCVGLQSFCLHMDLLPYSWSCGDEELEPEELHYVPGKLRSLRRLATRVRIFKIDIWLLRWGQPYDAFWRRLMPGSAWLTSGDDDKISWVCQGTDGEKSMVLWKQYLSGAVLVSREG